jgi:SAM-dependent methyltransferase
MSFGGEAALYDRARPSYPDELIDDLVALKPGRVLDVGCGTGKVARLLAARGCDVLGVEPDSRMADVARSHGIRVEVATFEAWEPTGRRVDLLVSGQAWHWVEPTRGAAKAAGVLLPGGHLAAFWNLGAHDAAVLAVLEPVYRRRVPEIAGNTTALRAPMPDQRSRADSLDAGAGFSTVKVRSYPWEARYTREQWLDFLATHSDHARLEPKRREALFAEVGAAIDGLGGTLPFHFQTVLILATRAAAA